MALLDDWVRAVQDTAAVPPACAAATVRACVRLLGTRLPSPLYGELLNHLRGLPGLRDLNGTGPSRLPALP